MKTALVLNGFAVLSLASCAGEQAVRLDPTVPHQISRPVDLRVWVPVGDGKAVEKLVRVDAGWWLASPVLLDAAR